VVTHGRHIRHLYIRQPSGTFYGRLYQDGKNKWVSLETQALDIAKIKLAEALQNHHTAWKISASVRGGNLTVGQLSEVHLQQVESQTDIKQSSKRYRHDCVKRLFSIFPELKSLRPAQVRTTELQSRFAAATERYAATAINGALDSARAIFKLALDRGLIVKNPAEDVSKVSVPEKKMVLPNTQQFKAIVEALRCSDSSSAQAQGDLVEFLAYSGVRIDEAKKITWKDIDFAKGRIYVGPGKNAHDRYVPMLSDMRDLLKSIQDIPRISRNGGRRESNFVLAATEVYTELPAACEQVGAPRITHHDLRHLFATKCIESGVDIPTVSRWLGHLDGGVLAMRVYGHLRDDHSQAMAAKVTF
jgi:integrase